MKPWRDACKRRALAYNPTVDPRFERPVYARLRQLCLALPDVTETTMWGHPGFRVGKRAFCVFEILRDRPSLGVRLGAGDARRVARGKQFFLTPYGRDVWVSRWLDRTINWRQAARLIQQGHRHVAGARIDRGKSPA